jgi:hypothetical protein
MAIYGGVREGWSYASGPRYNETLFRGTALFASAASVVVTIPLPARMVTHVASVALKLTTATPVDVNFTVGNYTGNQFTIYAWQPNAGGSATPAAAAITVGTSPYSYTSGTSYAPATAGETVVFQPTSTDTFTATITRGAVTTTTLTFTSLGPAAFTLQAGDIMAVTWATAAPSMWSFPFPTGSATGSAYSNALTVEWMAWANCAGVTGSY